MHQKIESTATRTGGYRREFWKAPGHVPDLTTGKMNTCSGHSVPEQYDKRSPWSFLTGVFNFASVCLLRTMISDNDLPLGFLHVSRVLVGLGHPHVPLLLPVAARTAQEAADALGVELGQIAKSVIMRRRADAATVLIVASGDRRVDERKVAACVGAVGRADASFVKERTGFSIGGVAPVGHQTAPVVLIDRELFRFGEIWAAAGHPNGVFRLAPGDLERLTGGAPVMDVVQVPA